MKIGQLVTSKQKLVSTSNKLTSLEIKQRALMIADGLTSTEAPNDMTAWYCKAYRTIGETKYAACASMARQKNVKKPRNLFGYLLKEEMKNAQ